MKKGILRTILGLNLIIFAIFSQVFGQATLVAELNFNNNLNDQLGNAVTMLYNNPTISYSAGALAWTADSVGNGGGLRVAIPDGIFTEENYSIAIEFQFSEVSGYRKVIDFNDRGADFGLYVNGELRLYSTGNYGPTAWLADSMYSVLITRSSSDDSARTYISTGTQLMVESVGGDTSKYFVAKLAGQDRILGFFYDDSTTSSEFSPSGIVSRIRIWNGIADLGLVTGNAPVSEAITFAFYPNPTHDHLNLKFESLQSGNVEILDATGRVLQSTAVHKANRISFDVTELPAGMYFVRVGTDAKAWIKR